MLLRSYRRPDPVDPCRGLFSANRWEADRAYKRKIRHWSEQRIKPMKYLFD
jgi:hypothetical protein